ncbi:MAG: Mov34/MPN/PAD-1 family protein [Armatimonadetes bacterium]|nr:Mov34/MPN/PAD-1 family protein [Armatimonadota bacterium]MDW8028763.1 Mov34/MPN/PAD-1 family protein [Armatimonadota bacterium]
MSVWLLPIAREVMVEHCKAVYPNEGCGILVGKRKGETWHVLRAVPTPNRNEERSHDRFEISPKDYLQVEKEARKDGLDVIGFFHSHPDVPPFPSLTDAQFAWSNYLTVIVGVFGGTKIRIRAHLFDGQNFRELQVYVPLQSLPVDETFGDEGRTEILDLKGEVEPFISISVRERLSKLMPDEILLIRFDYEPALYSLPRSLTTAGHQILQIRWNEDGFWEFLARSG